LKGEYYEKCISSFAVFATTLLSNVGNVTLLEGEAVLTRDGATAQVNLGDVVKEKDVIETKVNSKIKITFVDNTIVTIGKESSLNIEDYLFDANSPGASKSDFNVAKGAFHAVTGQIAKVNPSKFKIKTKNATIGIRGTEIYGDQSRIFCTKGAIYVESYGVTREVPSGSFVNIFDDKAPSEVMPMDKTLFEDVNSKLNTNRIAYVDFKNRFDDNSEGVVLEAQNLADSLSSWGYWNNDFQTMAQNNINAQNFSPTDPAYIDSLMSSFTVYSLSFSGSIQASGPAPTTNILNLTFNFGGSPAQNIVSGNVEYDNGLHSYTIPNINGTLTSSGFSAFGVIPDHHAYINGIFIGSKISTVAGNITMEYMVPPGTTVNGTFSITR
jgi:hypothetical protein